MKPQLGPSLLNRDKSLGAIINIVGSLSAPRFLSEAPDAATGGYAMDTFKEIHLASEARSV
jgi:hypothetical protein